MASSLILLFLSAGLLPLSHVQAGSLDIRDVLPAGMMDMYQDYELVHIDERDGEDLVYITERAPTPAKVKTCDDCGWFSPWDDDDELVVAKRDVLNEIGVDVNSTFHQLVGRSETSNPKQAKDLCKAFNLQGVLPLTFTSYKFPSNDDLEKKGYNNVYDFKPFDDPLKPSYYELKDIGGFQNRNAVGSSANRAVSVEHVLEWQVLLDFIQMDPKRCEQIAKYFQQDVDIDTKLKVMSKKGQGPVQDVAVKGRETAIEYIAHQYPGDEKSGIANKFMYEFVSLHDDVNGRKAKLWDGGKKGAKKPKMVNEDKMTKYMDNWYWTVTPIKKGNKKSKSVKQTKSDKNQGLCNAVVSLRDIIGVYKYHTTPEIGKILTAQINRIGAAFEYLETGPLKAMVFPDPKNPQKTITYPPMATSLKAQWDKYMEDKYESVITDIEKIMKTWTAKIDTVKVKRSLLNAEKRGTGSTNSNLCGEEPDKKDMNKRIDLVIEAYANKGTWKNPYKP